MSRAYSYDRLDMNHDEGFDPQALYDEPAKSPFEKSSPRYLESDSEFRDKDKEFASPVTLKRDARAFSESELRYDAPTRGTHQWSPVLLGIVPMAGFAAFLVLLIIGLEMLKRHSPYNAPSSSMQFFWTYFPVAVLMVVEWVWVAYDLQIKVLVPWAAMSRGFTPANRSWLLDYVGTNYFLSLWTAAKYRHAVILLATVGLWSTAVAGIVTTSLFQLQDVSHTAPRTLTRTTALDTGSSFTPNVLADKGYLNSYLGRQVLSLSRPRWTTSDNIVMEAFEDSSSDSTETLTAQTRGYSAQLNCTPAEISYAGNLTIPSTDDGFSFAYSFLVNVAGAECQMTYNLTDENTGDVFVDETYYYGRVYNHSCPGSASFTTVVAMASMRNYAFVSATAVECSPSYLQHTMAVSAPSSPAAPVSASVVKGSSAPFDAPAWQGMLQWINSTNGQEREFGPHKWSFEPDPWDTWGGFDSASCDCDPWLFLVALAQNVNQTQLLDSATLMNTTQVTFAGVWSDLAQTLLMTSPASAAVAVPGEVAFIASQMLARPTSVRIAQAALAVLIAVTLAVYLLRPRTVLPMDPASIAAQAFLVQHNHDEISAVIKDTATMSGPETQAALGGFEFSVQNQAHFLIAARRSGETPQVPSNPRSEATAWRPIILHPVFKVLLAIFLLGTIIALEFTLRRSIANDGFADLRSADQTSWTYFAPAYLFLLGIFISSYTFSISTLEPFFAMSHSPQPASKSVRYSPAHRTSIGLVFHALRYRSYVGFCCAAIMLVVPFTKIAVSGLITTASAPVHSGMEMGLQTFFNTTTVFPADDYAVGAVAKMFLPYRTLALSQIAKYGLPLPAWTTPVGAVGHVDLSQLGQLSAAPNATVTVPLPVMRGDLENCTALTGGDLIVLPSNKVQLAFPPMYTDSDGTKRCTYNNRIDTSNGRPENVSFTLPASSGWFGTLYAPWCGGYVMIYGNTQASNASLVDKMNVVQCNSYSLTMSTQNVTLAYKASSVNVLSIDPATQNTIPMTSFRYNESGYLVDHTVDYETNSTHAFDGFMQILTLKNTSVPLDAYLDPATLISAAQALYTTYWSIFATLNLVLPVNSTTGSLPVRAVVNSSRERIIQAETPTRTLQALLACVLAFGILTALAVRKTKGVLTKPPYSIGATIGLLADSAFVELEGLKEVRKEEDLDVLLRPYLFSLGWGANTKGGNRFGVDIASG